MTLKNEINFSENDDGVSPVVGMVLILTIATVSIGLIYTAGIPLIDNAKFGTHMKTIQKSFGVLHSDIEEVIRGPITGAGTARTTRIYMDGGSLVVEPNSTQIVVSYNDGTNTSITRVPGTISYEYKGRSVIYENGAVFNKYITSSVMENEPLIYAVDMGTTSGEINLMIHIINITGVNASTGGRGVGKIRTSIDNGVENLFSGDVNNVTISIISKNYDAWGRYFNDTVSKAGLNITDPNQYKVTKPDAETVRIEIHGAANNPYIHLTIYETKIHATAE